jgi:hypothetical protein
MTTIRTDVIPNLYANPIATISKASPAVVTVPVIAKVVSTTGTIGTVTGSGTGAAPWTATLTNLTTADGVFVTGQVLTATAGTGTFAAGGTVTIYSITGTGAVVIHKVGGTVPTAGTVTNVSFPAVSSLPIGLIDSVSPDQILFTLPGNTFTFTSSTATFQAGEIIAQPTTTPIALTSATGSVNTATLNYASQGSAPYTAGQQIVVAGVTPSQYNGTFTVLTSSATVTTYTVQNAGSFGSASAGGTVALAATGLVTNVFPTSVSYTATNAVPFNTTYVVTGNTSGATTTPTAVTGMNQLLTAGIGGSNKFYVSVLTPTTFALYTDSGLSVPVDSSAFTTATAGAGQYTTFDTVLITTP